MSACAPLNLGKAGLQLRKRLVRLLHAAPGFLTMVQLVDAAKNADDRMSGNVPRFSRTRFGICIGVGIGPGVVLRRLAVASSTKHYTIQRSHNTATTSIVLSGCPRACAASVLELELYIPKMAAHRLSPGRLQLFVLLKLCEKFLDYDASSTAVAAPSAARAKRAAQR